MFREITLGQYYPVDSAVHELSDYLIGQDPSRDRKSVV